MGERGKRSRSQKDYYDGDSKNQRRRGSNRDERGNDELIAYRILCPDGFIGSVIGKSGKVINSIRQETGAKVKVVDPFPGAKDRVLTIYSYVKEKDMVEVDDEFDDSEPLCPAQDALLKVYDAILLKLSEAIIRLDVLFWTSGLTNDIAFFLKRYMMRLRMQLPLLVILIESIKIGKNVNFLSQLANLQILSGRVGPL